MNKTLKIIVAIIAAILIIWAIVATVNRTGKQEENKVQGTVKIGVIVPLSGDTAAYGEQIKRILDYELSKINEKFKVKGIIFEAIYEDGKCTGGDAANAFQKLTDIEDVKFIIGGVCSSETLSMAPLATEKNILVLSPSSTSPKIEGASKYVYSFVWNDVLVAETLAEQMSKYTKVAIITEQNDYNIAMRDAWLAKMEKYPTITIVANETFAKGGTDFRSILEKVRKSNPEAIFLNPNAGITAQNLIKQLAEIKNWSNYQLFSHLSYSGEESLKAAPSKTEGMILVDAPEMNNKEFLFVYKKIEEEKGTLGELGPFPSAATIDAINILTDLIFELGENPIVVRDALISRSFKGYISSDINFYNSNFPNIKASVYVVKNSKLELMK